MIRKNVSRLAEPLLDQAPGTCRVRLLVGRRQAGKSKLARSLVSGQRYLSLDDTQARAAARSDPDALVRGVDRLIVDEVQRARARLRSACQGRPLMIAPARLDPGSRWTRACFRTGERPIALKAGIIRDAAPLNS